MFSSFFANAAKDVSFSSNISAFHRNKSSSTFFVRFALIHHKRTRLWPPMEKIRLDFCTSRKNSFLPLFLGEMQRMAFRLMLSSCVCLCVCLCMCVCMTRFWTPGKRFEIEISFFFTLRGITPHIICKSLKQIGLQIPRWRTKWGPSNTIIDRISAIY